jgi:hypothetical protein
MKREEVVADLKAEGNADAKIELEISFTPLQNKK